MLDILIHFDKELTLLMQGYSHPLLDYIMYYGTQKYTWIPLYIFLTVLLIKRFKAESIFYLLSIALLIFLCDKTASALFKPYFERLRPCNDPEIQFKIHTAFDYCTKSFGFFSSHAANSFGLAVFLSYVLRDYGNKLIIGIFTWAIFHSYTRIYLGQHFFFDILVGSIVGSFWGWFIYRLTVWGLRIRHK